MTAKVTVRMPESHEEAKRMAQLFRPNDDWDSSSDYEDALADEIAQIQRHTLLAAVGLICWKCGSDHADKYPLDPSGSYHISDELTNGVQPCDGAKLRAVAERIGAANRPKEIKRLMDSLGDEVKQLIEQLCKDLNGAHDELMAAEGAKGDLPSKLDWPEWTPQANSIRCAERLLGKKLAKTNAWTEFPTEEEL